MHNYGVEEGLPSSEVYSAFQDSKGYMWFATDAGVSRFNGYEFENFDVSDGLTDNTVFLITEDHKGRVWFGTFNCQLSYYENDSIHPYRFNYVLKDSLIGTHVLCNFNIDSKENVWLGFNHKGLKKISSNGTFYRFLNQKSYKNKLDVIKLDKKIIYGLLVNKNDPLSLNVFYSNQENSLKQQHYFVNWKADKIVSNTAVVGDKGITIIMNPSARIFYHNEAKDLLKELVLPNKFNEIIMNSLFYEDDLLYICSKMGGVYQCKIKSDTLLIQNHFLDGISISRMFKDNEGNYWFMSLDNGIYYCTSILINNNMKPLADKISSIKKIIVDKENNLFFSTKKGELFKQNLLTDSLQYLITSIPQSAEINFSYDLKTKQTLIAINKNLFSYKNEKFTQLTFNKKYIGRVVLSDSNRVYFGSRKGLYVFENKKEVYPGTLKTKELFFYTSLIKNGKNIWLGTNDGIRIYGDKKITKPYVDNKYLSSAITSMFRLNKYFFLIGTKSYGLIVMKNDSVVDVINREKGLIADLIRKIHVDDQGVIWVGTNKGLSKIVYDNNNNYEIFNLTKKHGLVSGEIIDLCSYKNFIYLTTSKGLIQFDKTKVQQNTIAPLVYITQFKVNTQKIVIEKNIELTYQENFIKIHYEGLNYRSLGEVEYQYRMIGVDTNWVTTLTREI